MQRQTIRLTLILVSLLLFTAKVFSQEINPNVLYKLVSPSGLVLEAENSSANATLLSLSKAQNGSKEQVWKIEKLPNGSYAITNPFTNKSIDNDNEQTGNGNPAIIWDASKSNRNQQWNFAVTGMGSYLITQRSSGMNLAFSGEDAIGTKVYQLPNSQQAWRLVPSNIKAPKEIKQKPSKNVWENETIFAINKEPGHATYY
ncbi:MAG: RICIN domain-containing protein, partial [Dysgonomonas sp.]|nr:RICIN domain-containing protein [Dysgonomonas sp.]